MKKIIAIFLGLVFFTASSSALSQEEFATVIAMQTPLEIEPENATLLSELGLT
jgi:hypothetical protein